MDLTAAAERLDVHYQTVWRWVRIGQLRAVKQNGVYIVDEVDVEKIRQHRSVPQPPAPGAVRDWAPHVARLSRFLAVGDERSARRLVGRLAKGGVPTALIGDRLLRPVLRGEIDECSDDPIVIAHEHRGAAIVERLLSLVAASPVGRPRGSCVVACPRGERHSLPALMATATLRADRFVVHHLGDDVPRQAIVTFAREVQPAFVVLSVTLARCRAEARRVAAELAGLGLPTLIGSRDATLRDLLDEARVVSSSPAARA